MKLNAKSLDWALKHIRKDGDTDLFPRPFEFDVIKKYWQDVLAELSAIDIENHEWQGPRHLVVPKSEFGFRSVCQLDPRDAIMLAGLIKEIGRKIERKRFPPSDSRVFSYRFFPRANGQLYAATTGWEDFWKTSERHSKRASHVLVTDFSDYYNQIYHHTVENQLDECGIDDAYWKSIKNMLANVSEGVSRGIPIGPHPTHLLAELAMIPIDQFLAGLNVPYCRYVDDIHIFCTSARAAHSVLFRLVDHIDKTQKIQLNRQKTSIVGAEEFRRICKDNAVDKPINALERRLLRTVKAHTDDPYQRVSIRKLSNADLKTLSKSRIEKVLKQYLAAQPIDYVRLRWFIRRLAQVGAPGAIEFLVKHCDRLLPAISEIGQYFEASAPNYEGKWKDIGAELLRLHSTDIVQASEYLRVVILSLFSRIVDLNHINALTGMYDDAPDMCQRKIMLAAAQAKQGSWLARFKGGYKNAGPWNRRAMLYSLRALPKDEKQFWLRSVKRRARGLEALIVKYIE